MKNQKNIYLWLKRIAFSLFFLILLAGGIWAYGIFFPNYAQVEIGFTLGINKSLSEDQKNDIAQNRILLLTSDKVLNPVLSLWPLTFDQKEKLLNYIVNHIYLKNSNEARLIVAYKDVENAKKIAQMIVSSFQSRLEIRHKNRQREVSDSLEKINKNIKDYLTKYPNLQNEESLFRNVFLDQFNQDISFLKNKEFISHYVDAYMNLIHYQTILDLINKNLADEKESLLGIAEIANRDDLRELMRQTNILLFKITYGHDEGDLSDQEIKTMRFEYIALKKQIDEEIESLKNQLRSQIKICKNVLENLNKEINRNSVAETKKINFVKSEKNEELLHLLNARSKLKNCLAKKEALESELAILNQDQSPVFITKAAHTVSMPYFFLYKKYIFLGILSVFLILCVLILTIRFFSFSNKSFSVKRKKKIIDHSSLKYKNPHFINEKFLVKRILGKSIKRVAFFGHYSLHAAARVLIQYRDSGKKALIVDLSGNEIPKYIGDHLGILNVLLHQCALHQAIYQDSQLGVDILPKGTVLESELNDKVLSQLNLLLEHLEKHYDTLFIVVNSEPFSSLQDFLTKDTDILVCLAPSPIREGHLWVSTLQLCGYEDIYVLKDEKNT